MCGLFVACDKQESSTNALAADVSSNGGNPPAAEAALQIQGEYLRGDRQSTRLNSSHKRISYAIFCLKKKKKE